MSDAEVFRHPPGPQKGMPPPRTPDQDDPAGAIGNEHAVGRRPSPGFLDNSMSHKRTGVRAAEAASAKSGSLDGRRTPRVDLEEGGLVHSAATTPAGRLLLPPGSPAHGSSTHSLAESGGVGRPPRRAMPCWHRDAADNQYDISPISRRVSNSPGRSRVSSASGAADSGPIAGTKSPMRRQVEPAPVMLKVFLRTPCTSEKKFVHVPENFSVLQLKLKVQECLGIRASHADLTFCGLLLADPLNLAECGIASNAEVDVSVRAMKSPKQEVQMNKQAPPPHHPSVITNTSTSTLNSAPGPMTGGPISGRRRVCSPATNAAKPSRNDLVLQLFKSLDADSDGHLSMEEFWNFARLAGFEGSQQEWMQEFEAISSIFGSTDIGYGLDMKQFRAVLDHDTGGGRFCDDNELADLVHNAQAPQSSSSGDGRRDDHCSAMPSDGTVVSTLDGTIPQATYTFDGAPMSAEEMQPQNQQAASPRAPEAVARDNRGLRRDKDSPTRAWTVDGTVHIDEERQRLLRKIFELCDDNGDGLLHSMELKKFACCTGFDESCGDWNTVFEDICLTCKIHPQAGLSLQLFAHLVSTESTEHYCDQYCSTEELKEAWCVLVSGGPRVAVCSANSMHSSVDSRDVLPAVSHAHHMRGRGDAQDALFKNVDAHAPDSARADQQCKVSRNDLIKAVFRSCDMDKDGLLNQVEMLPLAALVGFCGTTEEWESEFHALLSDLQCKGRGLKLIDLERFLSDPSERGCFCSEQQLLAVLRVLNPEALERPDLIKLVFKICDQDCDGRLEEHELKPFASFIGFNGLAASRSRNVASKGYLDFDAFAHLINGTCGANDVCTDDQLRSFIAEHLSSHHALADKLFEVLDQGGRGLLSKANVQSLFSWLRSRGLDCANHAAKEFDLHWTALHGNAGRDFTEPCISRGLFARFVNGELSTDCFIPSLVLERALRWAETRQ